MTNTENEVRIADSAPQHFNQYQLSKRWNISQSTLERWRWLGRGPKFLKIGSRVLYRLADIEAYEAEQIRAGTPASEIVISNPVRGT